MIKVDGIDSVQKQLDAIAKRTSDAVAKAVSIGAQLVRSSAIKSIQQQSSGREVTRSREGGATYTHIAASEGSAPNTDTGRLAGSIHVDGKDSDLLVGTPLQYGADLEHGTARMKPRPWLYPALEANRERIRTMIKKAANK